MKIAVLSLLLAIPLQAADVETTIKRFYVELDALGIRGKIDGREVEQCSEMLTPGFRSLIAKARKDLELWLKKPKGDLVEKPPLSEGPLFTGVHEGGTFVRTESVEEIDERAYVTVRIRMDPTGGSADWKDLVILHKIDGDWKIDDILSEVGTDRQGSVRGLLID